MNSAFFANLTFVEMQARRIACRTDLFYITDTSRSGGEFSNQGKDFRIYAHNIYYTHYHYIIHMIFIAFLHKWVRLVIVWKVDGPLTDAVHFHLGTAHQSTMSLGRSVSHKNEYLKSDQRN